MILIDLLIKYTINCNITYIPIKNSLYVSFQELNDYFNIHSLYDFEIYNNDST